VRQPSADRLRTRPRPAGGSTALGRLADIPDRSESASSDDAPSTPDESASLSRRALEQIRPTVEPQTWNAFWNTTVMGRTATASPPPPSGKPKAACFVASAGS